MIFRDRSLLLVPPKLSLTLKLSALLPAAAGVPEIDPPALFSVSPEGKAPDTIDQL